MKIDKQEASGDIYNVAGDLNLSGGTLNVDAVYLNGTSKGTDLLSPETQQSLLSIYQFSYLDIIIAGLNKKSLIERADLKAIIKKLTEEKEIPLIGIPGSGKTCLIYQLSSALTNVIYLPLKGKSLVLVIANLINKIKIIQGEPLIPPTDVDSALAMLQVLLASSKLTVMLDDCEANPDVLRSILLLDKFENNFIYASRNESEFLKAGIEPYFLKSFSEEEVKLFLKGYQIELEVLPFNELYEASKGNPLYLFYYSQFQVRPLPKDVHQYHQAIWASLDARQQECLIYTALSYGPVPIQVISDLFEFKYLVEAANFVAELIALTRTENKLIEIFHPAFKEFIIEYLIQNDLLNEYKSKLGNYYLNKSDHVQAAYLLVDIDPVTINKIGFNVLPDLINSGELELANRIIIVLLSLKRTILETGYLNCLLSANYRMVDRDAEAVVLLDNAIALFKKARNKQWYNYALMNKAISLVEDGKQEEGLQIADGVFSSFGHSESGISGQLLVNFSKIYVDLHEYEKAAKASKMAYDIFEKLGNKYGMVSSLTNLCSALGKIKDYEGIAETYASKLLELNNDKFPFQIELILLNVLTSLNRVKGNYPDARKYGQRAIQLCQHYKLESKTVLNLVNYANILRDENNTEDAVKIYHEALTVAVSHEFKKDESRIYWILSGIYREKADYPESIRLIDLSIAKAREINYLYGIAHGYAEKAEIYLATGDKINAAETFEVSFEQFVKLRDFGYDRNKSLKSAILLYLEIGESRKANKLLLNAVGQFNSTGASLELNPIINSGHDIDIHNFYRQLSENYLKQNGEVNILQDYLLYLEYCLNNIATSKQPFFDLLNYFAANINANRFAKTILAILLEQSKELVPLSELKALINTLKNNIPGLYARETVFETVFIFKIPQAYNLEIVAFKDDTICLKLALNLILFLSAAPELIAVEKPVLEKACRVTFIMKEEFEKSLNNTLPSSPSNDIQTLHMPKPGYEYPEMIIVQKSFEGASNLITYPNNKVNMYFLGVAIRGIIDHFHHIEIYKSKNFSKEVTRKMAFFYGLTGIEETKTQKANYFIDLKKLEQIIKS